MIHEEEKAEAVPEAEPPIEHFAAGVGRGWHGLVLPVIDEIRLYNEQNPGCEINIDQIKEKYGTLRINVSRCPDYIQGMISIAEEESGRICEICGARGETVKIKGLYATLCKHHIKARKKSGYDTDKFRKIYRAAADTYRQRRWNSGLEDVILTRMKKENRFKVKTITEGKLREIRLEREGKRSSLYINNGKGHIKQKINVQWFENENSSLHEGYWYVMNGNEKISSGFIERKFAEKTSVKDIFSRLKQQKKNKGKRN